LLIYITVNIKTVLL